MSITISAFFSESISEVKCTFIVHKENADLYDMFGVSMNDFDYRTFHLYNESERIMKTITGTNNKVYKNMYDAFRYGRRDCYIEMFNRNRKDLFHCNMIEKAYNSYLTYCHLSFEEYDIVKDWMKKFLQEWEVCASVWNFIKKTRS